MKTKVLISLILTLFSYALFAQTSTVNGVMLAKEDYQAYQLKMPLSSSINGIDVIQKNNVVVVFKNENEKLRYSYTDIFGYVKQGVRYRSMPRLNFLTNYGFVKEENRFGIHIYSMQSSGYKNTYTRYFYSVSDTSEIKVMSLSNLEKDYEDHPALLEKLRLMNRNEKLTSRNKEGKFLIIDYFNQEKNL